MNKFVIGTAVLLVLICIGNASAETYEASITISYPSDMEDIDNGTWIAFGTYEIEKGESKNIMDATIKLIDLDTDTDTVMFGVTKDNDYYPEILVSGTDTIVDEDYKIKLNHIKVGTGDSGIIYEDDSVVSIWIEPNSADKLGLSEGDIPNRFNPIEYGKTAGWSSAGNTEEVILNVEKLEDVSGILVVIEGGDWEEIPTSDNDKRIFELYDNVEYTITVSYTEVDVWDGESDEVDVYVLSVSGLEASSSSTVSSSGLLGSFSNVAGSKISITTANNGTFDAMSGMSVNPSGQNTDGNYVWALTFDSAGTKRIDFVSNSGGEGYFDFQISAKQDTSESKVTEKDDGEDNNLGLILIVLGLVGAVVLILFNKKGKNKKGSMTSSPESNPI